MCCVGDVILVSSAISNFALDGHKCKTWRPRFILVLDVLPYDARHLLYLYLLDWFVSSEEQIIMLLVLQGLST